jgi:glycosyltransferase involved in cell wall biosynthesis
MVAHQSHMERRRRQVFLSWCLASPNPQTTKGKEVMIEVIIPALNESTTIRHIISACLHAPSIWQVHVAVDDKTTDNTDDIAFEAGAIVHRHPGVMGKAQLIKMVLPETSTARVMLCDGDYTRFSPHIAEVTTAIHHPFDTMRIIVPKMPTAAQWQIGNAPFPFHPDAWSVNSGLRSFPRQLAEELDLHGYLVETQLNQAAESHAVTVERLYEPGFVQPLRFSERRIEAMEADRAWGLANGVLHHG